MKKTLVSASLAGLILAGGYSAFAKRAGDAVKGKDTFEQCGVCHNVDNDEKKVGPALKGLYKHPKLKNGKPVTDENVLAIVNAGGGGMPSYKEILSDEEKDNVVAYLKTL